MKMNLPALPQKEEVLVVSQAMLVGVVIAKLIILEVQIILAMKHIKLKHLVLMIMDMQQ
jgi:hypothetical protein